MEELELDYESLRKTNPRLVMTSITPFGQTGPYRDFKATHITECALGGWSFQAGEAKRDPLQAAGWATHYVAGIFGAIGTTIALYHSMETGIGQHLDMSIMESIIPMQSNCPTHYHYLHVMRRRRGSAIYGGAVVARCKDGYVGANTYTVPQWEQLCRWMGRTDLLENPKYSSVDAGRLYGEEITEQVVPWFLDKYKDEVFHAAQELRIPFAPINTTEDLLNCPQLKAREWFAAAEHSRTGPVAYPGAPFKMSRTPWSLRRTAPLLGEHNEEILVGELGWSKEEYEAAKAEGAI
jgi:crotonobetainyl-CoA:carnitine CoA-transferase CaiB-like acyl-CoA transferase